ncbi:hypothetical protein [Rhodococcus sp. B50]|uniref:hypothetical protein n=1 Tax=Rhodococcus sp. B50 TaxID=2682847 RepID=UPI001BD61C6C|nr:hypothetical protein [Rhodococcus sp. B50]MBS9372606.1 hypothetical protein [Rhodococcus sp. B50]
MALRGGKWWKLVGLAGLVGVAATGAVAARHERQRRNYSPDEVRSVLHERYARSLAARDGNAELPLTQVPLGPKNRISRALRQFRRRDRRSARRS